MNKKRNVESYVFLAWEIAVVMIFYLILGIEWTSRYRKVQLFVIAICTLPISILVHEVVHYFVIRLFSREKVKFGVKRSGFWIKYVYIHFDGKLHSWQWVLVKIAPAVILSVIPTFLMLLTGYRSWMAFCAVMINFAASYKDFKDTIHIIRRKSV